MQTWNLFSSDWACYRSLIFQRARMFLLTLSLTLWKTFAKLIKKWLSCHLDWLNFCLGTFFGGKINSRWIKHSLLSRRSTEREKTINTCPQKKDKGEIEKILTYVRQITYVKHDYTLDLLGPGFSHLIDLLWAKEICPTSAHFDII